MFLKECISVLSKSVLVPHIGSLYHAVTLLIEIFSLFLLYSTFGNEQGDSISKR